MSYEVASFDHDSPSAPTLTLGMILGASGVSHPPLQALGTLSGTSSADGSFSDTNGYGQIASYGGYMYVADTDNNRLQRFSRNSTTGLWAYESKLSAVGTILGGGTKPALLSIDTSRAQIHVAAYDHYTASNWISVWNLSDWPSLTTGNRVRQYGANANTNTAGRAFLGMGLTVDATHAVVVSNASPYRVLTWEHMTGTLVVESTQVFTWSQPVTDGAGNWWRFLNGGSGNFGVYKFSPTTHAVDGATFNAAAYSGVWRSGGRYYSTVAGPILYYSGRIYGHDFGRVLGWDVDRTFRGEFASPGGLAPDDSFSGARGMATGANTDYPQKTKWAVVTDADGGGWLAGWDNNSNNTNNNCFVTLQPLSASIATWTKADWSAGTNTIAGLAIDGANLSAEKIKVRLRKNAGAYVTLVAGQFTGSAFATAISGLGTFTVGDTLTLELSLSTWNRLDGHATLYAARDKLSPTNVCAELYYTDTAATIFTPVATGSFKAKMGASGAFKARVQG